MTLATAIGYEVCTQMVAFRQMGSNHFTFKNDTIGQVITLIFVACNHLGLYPIDSNMYR